MCAQVCVAVEIRRNLRVRETERTALRRVKDGASGLYGLDVGS